MFQPEFRLYSREKLGCLRFGPGSPWLLFFLLVLLMLACGSAPERNREVIVLDGEWQVAEGSWETSPELFAHIAPVPGLVDMASPPFPEVGQKSGLREAFWYKKTFDLEGDLPEVAILKLHKAKYGVRVLLNGQEAGVHLPSFTPAHLQVESLLRQGENELLIAVGADREFLPDGFPTGWDFEKYLYIPGIYDSVEILLTGSPTIRNVQTVPDLEDQAVRVLVEVSSQRETTFDLEGRVRESVSGNPCGGGTLESVYLGPSETRQIEMVVPIEGVRLWTPEDPFLYSLEVSTGSDTLSIRFGMRTFRFDPETRRASLNGQPYFLRGSNVTILRFFEDEQRGALPWNRKWVRQLHRKFKSMHWNSLRYCIGFPPDFWYDIADEEGILIQDEFPIWLLNEAPENPTAEHIIPQYAEWMRERWNHPSVVIWDAQNESITPETGKAIQAVRHLDRSNRPWENGWAEPQAETDCVESHPYLFIRSWSEKKPFRLEEMPTVPKVPRLMPDQAKWKVPIIVNEYGWLWLTRDGDPTSLTQEVYRDLLGPDSTVEQRRLLYARYLAALTEFWRSSRTSAGVLHFCGLGYSRPGDKPRPEGGATSDHFLNVAELQFEPLFEQYVRDAFHPVGVMLDYWEPELKRSEEVSFPAVVINDLGVTWKGEIGLLIQHHGSETREEVRALTLPGFGREEVVFHLTAPSLPGEYTIIAELVDETGRKVRSLRDVRIGE